MAGTLFVSIAIRWIWIVYATFPNVQTPDQQAFTFPYELDEPDYVFHLSPELKEISGLTAIDSLHVAAVQDEKGIVFVLNVETGDVVKKVRFGSNADYEAIEKAGSQLYVLRSNGDLYSLSAEFKSWPEKLKSERIRTRLARRNDTEGLALSADRSSLLIACKEFAAKGLRGQRAVYRFDLLSQKVDAHPAFLFESDKIDEAFAEDRVRHAAFKPSALSVHPDSGHLYLLSSPNRLLIISDPTGNILEVAKIKKKWARQPEGLAILPDRSLLVASEAAGGRATLLRYLPKP